jgi:hypothetical protein
LDCRDFRWMVPTQIEVWMNETPTSVKLMTEGKQRADAEQSVSHVHIQDVNCFQLYRKGSENPALRPQQGGLPSIKKRLVHNIGKMLHPRITTD